MDKDKINKLREIQKKLRKRHLIPVSATWEYMLDRNCKEIIFEEGDLYFNREIPENVKFECFTYEDYTDDIFEHLDDSADYLKSIVCEEKQIAWLDFIEEYKGYFYEDYKYDVYLHLRHLEENEENEENEEYQEEFACCMENLKETVAFVLIEEFFAEKDQENPMYIVRFFTEMIEDWVESFFDCCPEKTTPILLKYIDFISEDLYKLVDYDFLIKEYGDEKIAEE